MAREAVSRRRSVARAGARDAVWRVVGEAGGVRLLDGGWRELLARRWVPVCERRRDSARETERGSACPRARGRRGR